VHPPPALQTRLSVPKPNKLQRVPAGFQTFARRFLAIYVLHMPVLA